MSNNCQIKFGDFHNETIYTWCSNCGNYGIHAAIKRALVAECVSPQNTSMFFDIGCNGNGSDKINGYRFHGLHGRVVPAAVGAHLANRELTVIAFGGDGATLNEGINHLIHAIRSDYNIMFVIHNNENFALTKGQASSATPQGKPMNSSPDGAVEETFTLMDIILPLKPSFAARTFSGDVKHMTKIFQAGLQHKGFSVVEVMQNCPTYNRETTHEWYQERVYDVETREDYDNSNLEQALKTATDIKNNIALGVLYHKPGVDYYQRLLNRKDVNSELYQEVKPFDVTSLFNAFK
jgi:2-oxoglutarate/2-oxoacid ferredoxin oxidoreductase subunit beta